MATSYAIALSGLSASSGATTFTANTEYTLTVNGTAVKVTPTANVTELTFGSYGTVSYTNGAWTFTAGSSVPAGDVTITPNGSANNITVVDFTNAAGAITMTAEHAAALTSITGSGYADSLIAGTATATIKGGAGKDTITSAAATTSIDGGADDDTINLDAVNSAALSVATGTGNDTVTISKDLTATAVATIDLGDGTDTLIVSSDLATEAHKVVVNNYTYGVDTIKGTNTTYASAINANSGAATLGNMTVNTTADANVFKIAVTKDTTTKDWWTAKADQAVTMDASAVKNVTTLDASQAKTAVVTGSATDDAITLSGTTKATLNVGKAVGNDTIAGYKAANDTLNFVGGTVKDLKFNGTTTVGYSDTNLIFADGITAVTDQKLKVSFDGGTEETILANNSTANAVLDASENTDATVFVGSSKSGVATTIKSAKAVSLYDTDTYINISGINVAATAAAGSTFVGNSDKASAIDATATTTGVGLWGGSAHQDDIKLGTQSTKAADTVWFGSTDGSDTVENFDGGFGSTADVVRLWNVSSLSNTTFTNSDADTLKIKANGGSEVTIDETTVSDQIKVMLSDGTVKKVAFDNSNGGAKTIDAAGADVVIGNKATADSNTATYTSSATDALSASLWSTDVYQNIANINASGMTAAATTLVGSATEKSTLTMGTKGGAVWGGSSDSDTITLGGGTDVVWFGAADGKDSVASFAAGTDVVKFWDAGSVKEVFKNYTLGTGDAATTFTSKTNSDSVLTLTSVNTVGTNGDADNAVTLNASDAAGDTIKAVVNGYAGVSTLTFATDAQIYDAGATGSKVVLGAGITGAQTLFLDNGDFADNGSYYFGENVTEINGAASAASLTLVGRNNEASTLRGGLTSNAMWGGGQYNDKIYGNDSAVDTVWFGTSDGTDTFDTVGSNDVVHLYDVASANIANVTVTVGSSTESISLGTSKLNITDTDNAALKGGLTFTTSDNVAYTYNTTSKSFVQKA